MAECKIQNLIRGMLVGLLILAGSPSMISAGSASTSLSVSAVVTNNCAIVTSPMAFGVYDPIIVHATLPLDGIGTVTVTCTKGAVTTIALDAGGNAPGIGTTRAMLGGGVKLSYEIYQDPGRTIFWGNSSPNLFNPPVAPSRAPRSFTVYGRIPSGQDVPGGNYSDTVLATVNF